MKKKGTILIIDDSASIRVAIKHILLSAGFDVDEADDGNVALSQCVGSSYDLIITDLNMPNMDGIEFVKAAREIPSSRTVPIIMLTTETQASKRLDEAKKVGVSGWVVKPSNAQELAECATHLLSIIGRFL
ncbi:MAG: response regulator [Spirochaetia bacterium]